MRERPIIFSGPMVRAILDGRKTQTRRFLHEARGSFWGHAAYAPKPHLDGTWGWYFKDTGEDAHYASDFRCRYGVPGDRLWCKETFSHGPVFNADRDYETRLRFRANEHDSPLPAGQKWRPSIFMPRWASRLTLEITDVRVQRLQEINEEDARAEGVEVQPNDPFEWDARRHFQWLWDSINAKRAPWESNPWVWALTFKRVV